jgi:hypothetical protein
VLRERRLQRRRDVQQWPMRLRRLSLGCIVLAAGCSVPEVDFFGEDASIDTATDVAVDATGQGDGSSPDASSADAISPDAIPSDASTDGGGGGSPVCPDATPSGATTCCGSTPCVDHSGNGCNCPSCQAQNCNANAFCCVDSNGNVSCKNALTSCK